MSGVKYDQDKPRMDLLDQQAIEGLAKILGFGAKKYAAHNWRGGLSYSRLLGAALRHLFAILRGEDNDPESGLPHVDHLGCCWMFLSNMMKTRPDMDDRWKDKSEFKGTVERTGEGFGAESQRLSVASAQDAPSQCGCPLCTAQLGWGGWGAAGGYSQSTPQGYIGGRLDDQEGSR